MPLNPFFLSYLWILDYVVIMINDKLTTKPTSPLDMQIPPPQSSKLINYIHFRANFPHHFLSYQN